MAKKPGFIDIPFPASGLNEGHPQNKQPDTTTPDCLNVRPYEVNGRIGGGQRPGLAKYFGTAINSTYPVDDINSTTIANPAASGDVILGVDATDVLPLKIGDGAANSAIANPKGQFILADGPANAIYVIDGADLKRYDGAGTAVWSLTPAFTPLGMCFGDQLKGSIIICGARASSKTIIKVNAVTGAETWAYDGGAGSTCNSVAIDSSDNVYGAGKVSGAGKVWKLNSSGTEQATHSTSNSIDNKSICVVGSTVHVGTSTNTYSNVAIAATTATALLTCTASGSNGETITLRDNGNTARVYEIDTAGNKANCTFTVNDINNDTTITLEKFDGTTVDVFVDITSYATPDDAASAMADAINAAYWPAHFYAYADTNLVQIRYTKIGVHGSTLNASDTSSVSVGQFTLGAAATVIGSNVAIVRMGADSTSGTPDADEVQLARAIYEAISIESTPRFTATYSNGQDFLTVNQLSSSSTGNRTNSTTSGDITIANFDGGYDARNGGSFTLDIVNYTTSLSVSSTTNVVSHDTTSVQTYGAVVAGSTVVDAAVIKMAAGTSAPVFVVKYKYRFALDTDKALDGTANVNDDSTSYASYLYSMGQSATTYISAATTAIGSVIRYGTNLYVIVGSEVKKYAEGNTTAVWTSSIASLQNDIAYGNFTTATPYQKLLTVISNGTLYKVYNGQKTAATVSSGSLRTSWYDIFSAEMGGKIYIVDGANEIRYTASTNTMVSWSAIGATSGMPSDPTLIAHWTGRGRIVLAGSGTNNRNWYMSAVNNPDDTDSWNYTPTTTSLTQAVAANNGGPGTMGDIITALIPYSKDVFVFGHDHMISMLVGDPAAGGEYENVTDQTGIAWGRAFTTDQFGTLYFWSSNAGPMRLKIGGKPEPMGLRRLDKRFADIDLSANRIKMAWDTVAYGLHVLVIPLAGGASTHYWWDGRTDGWFPVQYANSSHEPVSCYIFDGSDPDDRKVLLGCSDSYIRAHYPTQESDDSTAINSYVVYPPFSAESSGAALLLKRLRAVTGANSDNVTYSVYQGNSVREALSASTVFTGTWAGAGRQDDIADRAHGNAVAIKCANTANSEGWAMDQLLAFVEPSGISRKVI